MTATILTFVSRRDRQRAAALECAATRTADQTALVKAQAVLSAAVDRRAPEGELCALRRIVHHARIAAALSATRCGTAVLRAA